MTSPLAKTPAQRQQAQRARVAMGRVSLRVEPARQRLYEALVASELLSDADALDTAKLADAVTQIIDEWSKRWAGQ